MEKAEEGLASGVVDLAIGYFPDIKEANVMQQSLLRNSGFACVVRQDNRFLENGMLTRRSFESADHVAVRTEGRSHEVVELALANAGIERQVV